MPLEERNLLPQSFTDFIINYFDDFFIFADDYETLLVCLKMVLMASRNAKIKFSTEKSAFFTTEIKILGYSFNTKDVVLSMDKLKASAIMNMKKPASLYELHSRLASLQYQSAFLPYLKDILYPLHFLLRKKTFSWGPIEELAWTQAKALVSLNLQLTVPDPDDDLVLTTDASKVAAAACLFRVKDKKMQLVSVSSKYFSTVDLNKNSYMLEAISLAYALKVFAPYLLNCQAKVKIFTDARSLIFAKRMSTHSILLNSTLNYLTNFVSLLDVEIYHLPGNVNVLADVLSRAISNNLNCNLSKEHPFSKQWAASLPPMPEKFSISHDVLYKFLTKPLTPEPQDLFDRSQRKLTEPKSLQEAFDLSQQHTPEEKYFAAISLLEQWNSKYARENSSCQPNQMSVHTAKLTVDLEKQRLCLERLQSIMDEIYPEIKNTPLYKQLHKNLIEASKRFLYIQQTKVTTDSVNKLNEATDQVLQTLSLLDAHRVKNSVDTAVKQNYIESVQIFSTNSLPVNKSQPTVYFRLHPDSVYKPKICEDSNGLDLPFQEDVFLAPHELKKVNLGVQFQLPKHFCALLMNKSSARLKYEITVTLGLIDKGFQDYIQVVIQNMSKKPLILPAGTAVAQLLLIKSKIPEFVPE